MSHTPPSPQIFWHCPSISINPSLLNAASSVFKISCSKEGARRCRCRGVGLALPRKKSFPPPKNDKFGCTQTRFSILVNKNDCYKTIVKLTFLYKLQNIKWYVFEWVNNYYFNNNYFFNFGRGFNPVSPLLRTPLVWVHYDAVFNRQKTRTVTRSLAWDSDFTVQSRNGILYCNFQPMVALQ